MGDPLVLIQTNIVFLYRENSVIDVFLKSTISSTKMQMNYFLVNSSSLIHKHDIRAIVHSGTLVHFAN